MDYKNYHRDLSYEKSENLFRNIFQNRFNIISRYVKQGAVLDIGCSTGTFLEIFKNKGFEVWGVEPSLSYKIAKKRSIKIFHQIFEEVNLPKNYFDVVVMNHTLEHVTDAKLVLKKIHSLLKKGGILFIDVPNAGSFSAKILKDKWPYKLPEEHTYQFTKSSLGKLLTETGFKLIFWKSRSGVYEYANPIKEIFSSLTSLKKRFFIDLLTLPYASFVTLINRGDSMSFVAKKQ